MELKKVWDVPGDQGRKVNMGIGRLAVFLELCF